MGTDVVTLLVWALLGIAVAILLWVAIGRLMQKAAKAGEATREAAEDGATADDDEGPQPAPLSYADRMALAERLSKPKPRFFWAGGYGKEETQDHAGSIRATVEDIQARLMAGLEVEWALFREFTVPDGQGPIDFVLVGPGGIFALVVEGREGGAGMEGASSSGGAAVVQAQRLEDYLRAAGPERKIDVRPVLLVAQGWQADSPNAGVEVWQSGEIESRTAALGRSSELSLFRVNRLVALLEQRLIDQAAATV